MCDHLFQKTKMLSSSTQDHHCHEINVQTSGLGRYWLAVITETDANSIYPDYKELELKSLFPFLLSPPK